MIHSSKNSLKLVVLCFLILSLGVGVSFVIFSTEPAAKKEAATKRTPMLVDVMTLAVGDHRPTISALGTVKAAQLLSLQAEVSGTVLSHTLVPGAQLMPQDVLLKIDPSDYEERLRSARSELLSAQAQLDIELGEQAVAEAEFKRIKKPLSDMQKNLVLREPQLQVAKARVESARALVNQAASNLKRTVLQAPFAAQVLERRITLGSYISPGQVLARLAGTEEYWVEASVPQGKLSWLDSENSVQIRNQSWPKGVYREGRLLQAIGELQEDTRLAKILVSVDDPLALKSSSQPLILGEFVHCELPARTLTNSVRLPREYLRKNNTVWLMKDERLEIRSVAPVYLDSEYAFFQGDLQQGERLVLTDLSRIRNGAELRLKEAQ